MSDGISEGYRATRASNDFEKIWTDAQIERILLDIKSDVETLSEAELYKKLINQAGSVRITHNDGWLVEYKWGKSFQTSIESKYADQFPKMRQFLLEVSYKIHRSYRGYDVSELMKEALIFIEWCQTDQGKHAIEVYNDY